MFSGRLYVLELVRLRAASRKEKVATGEVSPSIFLMLLTAGLDSARASEVHAAVGGLPGFLEEVLVDGTLDAAPFTEGLARSPAVRGALRMRLSQDDRDQMPPPRHARGTLRKLLRGVKVRALAEVEDQLRFPEIRLYYDGLVTADASGATVFRCEAVRVAAMRALKEEKE